MYTVNADALPVNIPPHIISTITTFSDQFCIKAIFVKLYVAYATTPKTIPVQRARITDSLYKAGFKIIKVNPNVYIR